ncbi:hypothetical protein Y694_01569 [Methylibium sp. T29-B]|nr:hypothetical protein Y694_01569 [Methylibium sp. T29-B]
MLIVPAWCVVFKPRFVTAETPGSDDKTLRRSSPPEAADAAAPNPGVKTRGQGTARSKRRCAFDSIQGTHAARRQR